MSSRRCPLPSNLAAIVAVAATVLFLPALPAAAYPGCSDSTPAVTVPQTLWAGLAPAADKPFADTTAYNGHQLSNHQYPLWSAADVEGDFLFATYTGGFAVYELKDPAKPKRVGLADLRTKAFPRPVTWFSELRDFIYFVDAPSGRTDVAVTAGLTQAGLTVFDTSTPGNPIATYQDSGGQDPGKDFTGVYTAKVGQRLYAFAGVSGNTPGLHVYDLDAALKAGGCGENSYRSTECSGVLQPPIDESPVGYLGGIELGGGKHLLVTSGGSGKGVKVWEIVPSASFGYQATQRLDGLAGQSALGVAIWAQGSKTYLAVRSFSEAQIYDISSCMSGSCSTLSGKEVGQKLSLGFISGWQSVTFSRAGDRDSGTPHLYFGNDGKCHSGLKKEWLYDVSNPASPIEISGNGVLEVTANDGGKGTVDYWSFSYSRNPSGFSQVMPRMGKFAGDHFYRVAWTIMEAHQRNNVEPAIQLFGGTEGYPGVAQTFSAEASNCTPTAGWDWAAGPDATISGSGSTVQITWSSVGTKTVTATNDGCGNASGARTVILHDPAPAIGGVSALPTSAYLCQPVTFSATGVTGQPPLSRTWRVEPDGGGTPIALASTGDQATWTPASTLAAGKYRGWLEVDGTGAPAEKSAVVTLLALPSLPIGGSFAPTKDAFASSTVQFHVNVPGATEWAWDFDGDGVFAPWTSHSVSGPNPEFTYTEEHVAARCGGTLPCTFEVRVKVRNCVEGERLSNVLAVEIQEINPVEVHNFSAQCLFGTCGFEIGEQVTFNLDVGGDPDEYHFDWDGNGTYEDKRTTSPGSTVKHSYDAAGTYTPVLRVTRGGQNSDPFPVAKPVVIVKPVVKPPPPPPPPPPKSIHVNGPNGGEVGQALTYTASANGCTPVANGWTWSTGGGTGSSTTSSISLTFGTPGGKTVTATNSGCSGVSGSRNTTITGDVVPSLTASFAFAPALPEAGQKVHFDGTGSKGEPEFYYWRIEGQLLSGAELDYTFSEPGSYPVTLEVSKRSTSCSLGMCTATTTKTVNITSKKEEKPEPPPVLGNGCSGADAKDDSLLCLLDGRFRIHVDWINQHAAGEVGVGRSVRSAATGDTTGFFWFFNDQNIELLVKMLDGSTVNGHYWFFYGGLSNVEYAITVDDTVTGQSKVYRNLPGTIGGTGDSAAFPVAAGSSAAAVAGAASSAAAVVPRATQWSASRQPHAVAAAEEESDELVLLDGRFEVEVEFTNQHAGDAPGLGRAVAGTNNAGYFWFFTRDNLELVVKMIDARPFDGHFWVFWAGLSDVKYNITIRDLQTGEKWEFHNPAGMVGGGADTSAFGG